MRKLSTHVLDTAHGRPAADVAFRLFRLGGPAGMRPVPAELVLSGYTNSDGRTDVPLLTGDALLSATYALEFDAGDYFRRLGVDLPSPAFVDVVVLRFGIADGDTGYHVPLLVSPWSWSSYRGS